MSGSGLRSHSGLITLGVPPGSDLDRVIYVFSFITQAQARPCSRQQAPPPRTGPLLPVWMNGRGSGGLRSLLCLSDGGDATADSSSSRHTELFMRSEQPSVSESPKASRSGTPGPPLNGAHLLPERKEPTESIEPKVWSRQLPETPPSVGAVFLIHNGNANKAEPVASRKFSHTRCCPFKKETATPDYRQTAPRMEEPSAGGII